MIYGTIRVVNGNLGKWDTKLMDMLDRLRFWDSWEETPNADLWFHPPGL